LLQISRNVREILNSKSMSSISIQTIIRFFGLLTGIHLLNQPFLKLLCEKYFNTTFLNFNGMSCMFLL